MPDIKEFQAKLKALKDLALQKLPDIATTLTLTAKALAERRIRESGFGADYSNNKIPAFFLEGKELNGSGTAFLKQHGVFPKGEGPGKQKGKGKTKTLTKEDRLANWKEFRAAQGLPVGFVDLAYSNKMYAGMGPLSVVISGTVYSAPLGATNQQALKEMNFNYIRYGDFIGKALQEDDFVKLREFSQTELINLLNEGNINHE